jgi:hypothetical protein
MRVNRPFLLPTSKYAGGLEVSLNESINTFGRSTEEFRTYRYLLFDSWSAFSLSPMRSESRRLRKGEGSYLSGRLFHQTFFQKPTQEVERFNAGYNNRWFLVGGITFFRQSYYKTRYVSGFGKTEDVPYGHKIAFYTGYQYALNKHRYYGGVELLKQFVRNSGSFGLVNLSTGAFLSQGKMEDVLIRGRAYWYSRLLYAGRTKWRQQFYSTYTIVLNPVLTGQATINDVSGIRGFSSGYTIGRQRLVVRSETMAWLPTPVFGFRLQPFVSVQAAQIGAETEYLFDNRLYTGLGCGFRIRNENLIFKTLEVRMFYYPNIPEQGSQLVFDLSTVIPLNFSEPMIHSPSFVTFD